MKHLKYIVLFLFISSMAIAGGINFEGHTIEIEGTFQQLAIHGTDENGKVSFSDLLDNSSLLKNVTHKIDGSTLKITLEGSTQMRMDIPKNVNILCKPKPIIYEGSYIHGRDAHHIHVQNTSGEVEISCDGYKVTLHHTSGSISVVSHEDIEALLSNIATTSIVSLDTYMGDILLRIPHTLDPKIKATAPKGSITIKGDTALFNGNAAIGNQVLLHSETGKQIFVTSLMHLPDGPSHPELRDQLIKIYIEDQGKLRMDNEARKELTAMGYGPFIESLDDVYKGHFYTQKHIPEFKAIVDKYGFPTEEMVGFEYALGAVRQVLLLSDRSFIKKHEDDIKKTFGDKLIKFYNRINK